MVGSFHGCPKDARVRIDVSKMVIIGKFASLLDTCGKLAHLLKAGLDASSSPINDHANLLIIIDPDTHFSLISIAQA